MKISGNMKRVVITVGPAERPYVKIFLPEKRSGRKDRRKIITTFAQERRAGIVDRRKPVKLTYINDGDNLISFQND
jgi:hypothetical protein